MYVFQILISNTEAAIESCAVKIGVPNNDFKRYICSEPVTKTLKKDLLKSPVSVQVDTLLTFLWRKRLNI